MGASVRGKRAKRAITAQGGRCFLMISEACKARDGEMIVQPKVSKSLPKKERRAMLQQQEKEPARATIEHLWPQGREHERPAELPRILVVACARCNNIKSGRDPTPDEIARGLAVHAAWIAATEDSLHALARRRKRQAEKRARAQALAVSDPRFLPGGKNTMTDESMIERMERALYENQPLVETTIAISYLAPANKVQRFQSVIHEHVVLMIDRATWDAIKAEIEPRLRRCKPGEPTLRPGVTAQLLGVPVIDMDAGGDLADRCKQTIVSALQETFDMREALAPIFSAFSSLPHGSGGPRRGWGR